MEKGFSVARARKALGPMAEWGAAFSGLVEVLDIAGEREGLEDNRNTLKAEIEQLTQDKAQKQAETDLLDTRHAGAQDVAARDKAALAEEMRIHSIELSKIQAVEEKMAGDRHEATMAGYKAEENALKDEINRLRDVYNGIRNDVQRFQKQSRSLGVG